MFVRVTQLSVRAYRFETAASRAASKWLYRRGDRARRWEWATDICLASWDTRLVQTNYPPIWFSSLYLKRRSRRFLLRSTRSSLNFLSQSFSLWWALETDNNHRKISNKLQCSEKKKEYFFVLIMTILEKCKKKFFKSIKINYDQRKKLSNVKKD